MVEFVCHPVGPFEAWRPPDRPIPPGVLRPHPFPTVIWPSPEDLGPEPLLECGHSWTSECLKVYLRS